MLIEGENEDEEIEDNMW